MTGKRQCADTSSTTSTRRRSNRSSSSGSGAGTAGRDRHEPFKEALVGDGIPFTAFAVDDVRAEYQGLRGLGVRFTQEPTDLGPVTTAVLDDTCGNLIQIMQQAG